MDQLVQLLNRPNRGRTFVVRFIHSLARWRRQRGPCMYSSTNVQPAEIIGLMGNAWAMERIGSFIDDPDPELRGAAFNCLIACLDNGKIFPVGEGDRSLTQSHSCSRGRPLNAGFLI
jgi:hypothetical protein